MDRATLSIIREFREATTWQQGGEVVLRSGEQTGRVFFSGGCIAWVVASSIKQTFFGHLTEVAALSRDDLHEVFEACKQSGDNFADTIVEWGLLDEPTLRVHLLEYIASCLVEVLSWPELHAMGMPEARPFKGNLTFELETVLAQALQQDQAGKLPFAGSSVVELLDALEEESGVEAADVGGKTAAAMEPATGGGAPAEGGEASSGEPGEAADAEGDRRSAVPLTAVPTMTPEVRQPPQRRVSVGLIATVVVLLLAAVGVAAWYFTRGGAGSERKLDVGPLARVDARPADAAAPDAPRPDQGIDAAKDGSGDARDAKDGSGDARDAKDGSGDARDASRAPDAPVGPEGILVGVASKGRGKMRIASYPSRSKVFLDGFYLGRRTPTKLDRVSAGVEHIIVVERRGYRQAVKRFKLAPGMQAQMHLSLRRTRRRLTKKLLPVRLVTEPPGASIVINGARQEQLTPATVELDRRRISKVVLRLKGFRPWRRRLKPPPEVPLSYQIKLRPRRVRRRVRRRRTRRRPGR